MTMSMSRRSCLRLLLGSAVAAGLLATSRIGSAVAASVPHRPQGGIPVRMGEIVQAGREFRNGELSGVRVVGFGGSGGGLRAERSGGQFISQPLLAEFSPTHVGVHWSGDASPRQVDAELRFSRDGARWSGWRPLSFESHGRTDDESEYFAALVGVRGATFLQYRLMFSGDAPAHQGVDRVALTYLHAGASRPGGARFVRPSVRSGPLTFLDQVISREAWGADESIRFEGNVDTWPRAFVTPKFVAVHHTATDTEYADPAAEVRAIYAYHTVTQGFGDIGYHLLIDNRGQAYEGRIGREAESGDREIMDEGVVAGHARGFNYGSAGIAVLGTFTEEQPSEPALETLSQALAFVATRHGLDPRATVDFLRARGPSGADTLWRDALPVIAGHRDCLPTECPGEQLYGLLPEIRKRVAQNTSAGYPSVAFTHGPHGRATWPGDLNVAWTGGSGVVEYSTRLEGFRLAPEPDLIVPLSGYDAEQREVWSPWSASAELSVPLEPDASGLYTLVVRARDARGRELPVRAQWPMFVDRHVLIDNRDGGHVESTGHWRRTSEGLAFNGQDYEEAEAPASFRWRLTPPETGWYRLLACWSDGENRTTAAEYSIMVDDEIIARATVNQRERGASWVELAQVPLSAGVPCGVVLSTAGPGVLVADAVRAVLVS